MTPTTLIQILLATNALLILWVIILLRKTWDLEYAIAAMRLDKRLRSGADLVRDLRKTGL